MSAGEVDTRPKHVAGRGIFRSRAEDLFKPTLYIIVTIKVSFQQFRYSIPWMGRSHVDAHLLQRRQTYEAFSIRFNFVYIKAGIELCSNPVIQSKLNPYNEQIFELNNTSKFVRYCKMQLNVQNTARRSRACQFPPSFHIQGPSYFQGNVRVGDYGARTDAKYYNHVEQTECYR
jgi:hypothetical protein